MLKEVDTISIDLMSTTTFPIHSVFMEKETLINYILATINK